MKESKEVVSKKRLQLQSELQRAKSSVLKNEIKACLTAFGKTEKIYNTYVKFFELVLSASSQRLENRTQLYKDQKKVVKKKFCLENKSNQKLMLKFIKRNRDIDISVSQFNNSAIKMSAALTVMLFERGIINLDKKTFRPKIIEQKTKFIQNIFVSSTVLVNSETIRFFGDFSIRDYIFAKNETADEQLLYYEALKSNFLMFSNFLTNEVTQISELIEKEREILQLGIQSFEELKETYVKE